MLFDIVAVTDEKYRSRLGDRLVLLSALDLSFSWRSENSIPYLWISSPYYKFKARFDISSLLNDRNKESFLKRMNTQGWTPKYLGIFFEKLVNLMNSMGYSDYWNFREYVLAVYNHAMSEAIDGYPEMNGFDIWVNLKEGREIIPTKIDKKGVHIWKKTDKRE